MAVLHILNATRKLNVSVDFVGMIDKLIGKNCLGRNEHGTKIVDRTYAIRNNAGRIWACTPQNCVTTNQTAFEKYTSFQGPSVCSNAIYRMSA